MAAKGEPQTGDVADDPGRPRARDEIDPELIRLPRTRARIGWLLALSVMVLSAHFLWRLRVDFAYSLQGDTPGALATVGDLAAAEPNAFVELTATPDRASLLWVFASEAKDGHRIVPLFGADDRAWLMLSGSHWTAQAAHDEVYRGRVRRLGDLPFFAALAARLEATPAPRVIAAEELRASLQDRPVGDGDDAGAPLTVADVAGDLFAVTDATPFILSERVTGRAKVTVFQTDALTDEPAWRTALAAAGLEPPAEPFTSEGQRAWSLVIDAPLGPEEIARKLVAAKLMASRVEPLDRQYNVTFGQLSEAAGGLAVAGKREDADAQRIIQWSDLRSIVAMGKRPAVADARVLVTTETPERFWYLLPLYIVFGGLLLLFGWALYRALRRGSKATGEETKENEG